LKQTKGYRHGRKSKERQAREAIAHAGNHAFAHRRDRKNDFRRRWQQLINAAARPLGLSYSRLAGALRTSEVGLNRKMLATIARENPETFERIVTTVNK
jgi:large subunit ribosomal protein L20